ncbi:hypothetical protein CROQUDRAFT_63413 [Cronartium quercuum f. sp. fusiforme G11]|uniref:Delta 8-(E)-sphingolipid desaturase n=1 Tax=Cronartium quercuum f. sp. fusiforme G11 TaxID=708437 RepID=A0A9P6TBP2_9BASI|nr:hypothetical protein CROQUDRAFT_63413 [Cronartium quercuum f. sp. fusiforme G11]
MRLDNSVDEASSDALDQSSRIITPSTHEPPSNTRAPALATFTREQIKARIGNGEVLVLHRSYVYKLNAWLHKHPGGELAILHFVGRDATDEIEAYHEDKVLRWMKGFIIGRVSQEDWNETEGGEGWKPLNPPVQIGLWPMHTIRPRATDPTSRTRPASGSEDSGYATADAESSSESQEFQEEKGPKKDLIQRHSKVKKSGTLLRSNPNPQDLQKFSETLEMSFSAKLEALEPDSLTFNHNLGEYDVSPARQQHLARSYRVLHDQIRSAGLYEAPRLLYGYGPDLIRYTILFIIFFFTSPFYPLLNTRFLSLMGSSVSEPAPTPSTLQYFISSVFLGLWWHQITFVAHDAGHSGITGDWTTDRLIGILIGDFLVGISIGWWCDNHDIHHLVTNHPEHDPDIQHLPFFAVSNKFFSSLRSTYYNHIMRFDGFASKMVAYQHRLYYFIMMFGRFNLFFNSYLFLANSKKQNKYRALEVTGIIFFWSYFGTLLYLLPTYPIRIMYLLVSFALTSPLHVQIVLSHFAQSTADLGLTESFAHRQIRTTMDVSCPPYLDFLHGGLHRQVTHHLFPRLPRHNLRRASENFVKPWCQSVGLVYESYEFGEGNMRVLNVLREVANQVKVLGIVAKAQARGEIHH